MAGLPQQRVCQMHCPVVGCPDLLPLPVETELTLANGRVANTISASIEVTPDCSAIWDHLRTKHGLPLSESPCDVDCDPDCSKDQGQSRCPTCDSWTQNLHPAMQHGGEVQICPNPWHKRV